MSEWEGFFDRELSDVDAEMRELAEPEPESRCELGGVKSGDTASENC